MVSGDTGRWHDAHDRMLGPVAWMGTSTGSRVSPDETLRSPAQSAPDRIGPCRVLHPLGQGGMGRVFAAELVDARAYLPPGSRVALKLLRLDALKSGDAFERFEQEARLGRAINHSSVARTYESGHAAVDGLLQHFLVMELIEGRTLASLFDDLGVVPEPLLRHVGARIANGLAALHALGAVHRDVKPSNVVITPQHEVKLVDLGIARFPAGGIVQTMGGTFLGTLRYAAPEQVLGESVGPAADLYALGATLFEGVTGRPVVDSSDMGEVMRFHQRGLVPGLLAYAPDASPFLDGLVAQLLAPQPEERGGSAAEIAQALEAGEHGTWWRRYESERTRNVARGVPRLPVARATDLVGRAGPLATLLDAAHAGIAGKGRCVLVEGEAGIGKSRLLAETVDVLAGSEPRPVILHGTQPPGGVGGGPDALARALVAHFGETRLDNALRRLLPETPRLAQAFAAQVAGRARDATDAELAPDAVPGLFAQVLRGLAVEGPLAWLVEDLHFAPAATIHALLAMARAAADLPVIIVACTRPGLPADVVAAFERLPGASTLRLDRLDAASVEELIGRLMQDAPFAKRVAPGVAAKSDGNPMFVLELVDELRARLPKDRTTSGPTALERHLAAIEVPAGISGLLRDRLGALSDAERALLDAAAVQGHEFDADLVAGTLGRDRLDVLQAFASLERRTRLIRAAGAGFRFDHHLLQELLYRDMGIALRGEYHARVARAFEERARQSGARALEGGDAVFVAEHLVRSNDPRRARPLLLAALEDLAARGQHAALVEVAERACRATGSDEPIAGLDAIEGVPPAARWHALLGESRYRLGDTAQAEEHLRRALVLLGEKAPPPGAGVRGALLREAVRQLAHLAMPAGMLMAREAERPRLRVATRAASRLANIEILRGNAARVSHAALLAVNRGERAAADSGFALALLGFVTSGAMLRRLGRSYIERAVEVARRDGAGRDLVEALKFDAVERFDAARLADCDARSREMHDAATGLGYLLGVVEARGLRGAVAFQRGDLDASAALASANLLLDEHEIAGTHLFFPQVTLAEIALRRERADDAAEAIEAARARVVSGDLLVEGLLAGATARLQLLRGDRGSARATAQGLLDRLDGARLHAVPGVLPYGLEGCASALLTCWELAKTERASDVADVRSASLRGVTKVRSWARLHPVRRPAALLLRGRAAALDGAVGPARDLLTLARNDARAANLVLDAAAAAAQLDRLGGASAATPGGM